MQQAYVVDFSIDCRRDGYGIFFVLNSNVELIEIDFSSKSPYYGKDGDYYYPSLGQYVLKNNGKIYNLNSLTICQNLHSIDCFKAAGSSDKKNVPYTRTIKYKWGTYTSSNMSLYTGYSTSLTNHSNNCANVAGLILLNYWNKYFKNDLLKLPESLLLKTYASEPTGNIYKNNTRDARKEFMTIFYDYMQTNWVFGEAGETLPKNAIAGFSRLIAEKGYTTHTFSDLSYEEAVLYMYGGAPLLITSTDYYFADTIPSIATGSGNHSCVFNYKHSYGLANAHTFVGYGYANYEFHIDGKIHNERFLLVADGWGSSKYFNFDLGNIYDLSVITITKNKICMS